MTRAFALALLAVTWIGAQPRPDRADVVYATRGDHGLKVDLFLPKSGAGPFPAVLYVHGGGWKNGNKSAFHRQAAHMATKGFVGVCVEYRLSGEATWPAAIDDVEAALAWTKAHASEYKIDVNRLGAAGGSAGGQLVALLGVRSEVKAVAAFNPAVDLIALAGTAANADNSVGQYLGGAYAQKPDVWKAASPALHVSKKAAKFLFLHGDADTTVPYVQSTKMREALVNAGVTAEVFTAPGAAHGFFNRDPWFQPTLERMEKFMTDSLR